ncbi:MAG: quinate 5-dehydrogenase [Clostridia bacterium]|nr:quinate 5-dehydrogenase [Clostridia bacterium]
MALVVSVSLGSSRRDFACSVALGGLRVEARRLGTDGDLRLARRLLEHFDGRAAAIGLGGVNLQYALGPRRYPVREARYLAAAIRRTPLVDGSGWKEAVEPWVVRTLAGELHLAGSTVCVVSALDRYPLAEALVELGCRLRIGDAYTALGLPILFPGLASFSLVARCTMPLLGRLPLRWLYPLGGGQERPGDDRLALFRAVDVLAGDTHLIRRRLPRDLRGKGVLASTLTAEDRSLFLDRGAAWVASLSPPLAGRHAGANLWEAVAVAVCGARRPTPEDLVSVWREAVSATPFYWR